MHNRYWLCINLCTYAQILCLFDYATWYSHKLICNFTVYSFIFVWLVDGNIDWLDWGCSVVDGEFCGGTSFLVSSLLEPCVRFPFMWICRWNYFMFPSDTVSKISLSFDSCSPFHADPPGIIYLQLLFLW